MGRAIAGLFAKKTGMIGRFVRLNLIDMALGLRPWRNIGSADSHYREFVHNAVDCSELLTELTNLVRNGGHPDRSVSFQVMFLEWSSRQGHDFEIRFATSIPHMGSALRNTYGKEQEEVDATFALSGHVLNVQKKKRKLKKTLMGAKT
jgi:hypothetical protein